MALKILAGFFYFAFFATFIMFMPTFWIRTAKYKDSKAMYLAIPLTFLELAFVVSFIDAFIRYLSSYFAGV
jgi:TRAP-type C4-dicarboxylate transport system permease small subunit